MDDMRWMVNLLFIALLCSGVSGVLAASPTAVISDFRVNPSVLSPGEIGTITVNLTNTAESAIQTSSETSGIAGNTVTSSQTLPISVLIKSVTLFGNEVEVLTGSYTTPLVLGPGQSTPLTFLIRAPPKTGIYFLKLWIEVPEGQSISYPIPINVNTQLSLPKDPSIIVVKTIPDRIIPGEQFTVQLQLTNAGRSSADNVDISVNTSSTTLLALSPNTYHINLLEPNETNSLNLSFATDRNARLGLTPIYLILHYATPSGTEKVQTEAIGVLVQGKASLSIASIRTDPVRASVGDSIDLTIRIENIGTGDANSVRATLSDLSLPGTREAFMGRIEPNNDAPAVFFLEADQGGDLSYNLTIQYSDDYGDHVVVQPLNLVIEEQSPWAYLVGVAVLIVAAVVTLLWYRKKQGK
jgi:hypothetical protein